MKKVLLKGPVLTNSGYGVHSRQVFKALRTINDIDLYVQSTMWGNTSWILDDNFDNGIISSIVKYCHKSKKGLKYDTSYQVMLPSEWQTIADKNVGITAGFEANIVKSSWIDSCNNMDHVIMPSEFSRNAFIETSINCNKKIITNMSVVNEWYYDEFDKCISNEEYLIDLKYDKNILIIGQICSINSYECDRKNILKTVSVAAEFVKDKDIGIILKVNLGSYSVSSFNKIKDVLKELLPDDVLKKVAIVFGSLDVKELKSLYEHKKISCMLSGTSAEGWGLPFIEAASCGMPIIAPNFSAYKEFLGNDFLKIEYDMKIVSKEYSNFFDEDTSPLWSNFREDSMKKCLRDFFKNEDIYIENSNRLKSIIKQNYNMLSIIEDYKKVFESNF